MFVLSYPENSYPRKTILDEVEHHKLRAIDGTLIKNNTCIGYCCSDIHPGYLDNVLVKEHKCNSQKCPSFYRRVKQKERPFSTHPEEFNKLTDLLKADDKLISDIMKYNYDGCLRVCKVTTDYIGVYVIQYIYPADIDEDNLKESMENLFSVEIQLERKEFQY